ncbi:hypothetical protein [Pseudomonas sp. R62]|uniref:hypothetical protein n=1 Tax=Pseudomonas sp. R62 TaxID=1144884 RepID=UPI001EE67E40|nr:hypothetical protein [Pseudomonas sp. R62]
MQNPEGHRETLYEMTAALLDEGLIDELERLDMNEMANAAYWHTVEELQNSTEHYRGASIYDVVQVDKGNLLGTISRSILNFANDEPCRASFAYDGKVYSDVNGVRLTLGLSRKIGKISGLVLEMKERRYQLIETERMIGGITRSSLSDADAFRALVDTAQVAQEERDVRTFEKIRPHIESAAFCICPACLDRFGEFEDCEVCAGKGFVSKLGQSSTLNSDSLKPISNLRQRYKMSALDIAPEKVGIEEYLELHATTQKKEQSKHILKEAVNLIPIINLQYQSPTPPPQFRIEINHIPLALGMDWQIVLSSGMINHCLDIEIPNIENIIPSLKTLQIDPLLSPSVMLKWVIAHEWMHVIRKHNDVENELGRSPELLKALEYDADLCALAIIYRQIQSDHEGKLNDTEIRQLTIHAIYWPLRHLNFFKIDLTHGTMCERLYTMLIKLMSLEENPYDFPSHALGAHENSDHLVKPLVETLRRCEEIYRERHSSNTEYQDFLTELMHMAIGDPPEAVSAWEKIRTHVGRISSTLT